MNGAIGAMPDCRMSRAMEQDGIRLDEITMVVNLAQSETDKIRAFSVSCHT